MKDDKNQTKRTTFFPTFSTVNFWVFNQMNKSFRNFLSILVISEDMDVAFPL